MVHPGWRGEGAIDRCRYDFTLPDGASRRGLGDTRARRCRERKTGGKKHEIRVI